MAIVPTAQTWAINDAVTSTALNAQLRDGFGFFLAPPRVMVYNTAVQQNTGTGNTLLTWNSTVIDSDGCHSNATNPSRLTAQTAGLYEVQLHLKWQQATDGANRYCFVTYNSNGSVSTNFHGIGYDIAQLITQDTAVPQTNDIIVLWRLNVGEYVEAILNTTTSATTGVVGGPTNFFAMRWISA